MTEKEKLKKALAKARKAYRNAGNAYSRKVQHNITEPYYADEKTWLDALKVLNTAQKAYYGCK